MGAHINKGGLFQSDKYPTCPAGKVPLSVKDPAAQPLLWEYAQRRRSIDAEFSADLEECLRAAGYQPPGTAQPLVEAQSTDVLVRVGKHSFRCEADGCGCNVFRRSDPKRPDVYVCNACGARYVGEV